MALLAVAAPGCARCSGPPAQDQEQPESVPFWVSDRATVESMNVRDVFEYMSGGLGTNNYPTLFADLATQELIVTGRCGRTVVADRNLDLALETYAALLARCDYVYRTADATTSPDALVAVALSDIFPSPERAKSTFSPEQYAVLYSQVSPVGSGFGYFSGNRTGELDYPAMYAWRYYEPRIVVIGVGIEKEFDIRDTEQAFAAYRTLLLSRGFKVSALPAADAAAD